MVIRVFKDEGDVMREIRPLTGVLGDEGGLQAIIQKSLKVILLNHDLTDGEFLVDGLRVDTVAFNKKINSFIIIEYKNTEKGITDQAMAYLQLLDEKQADFLECYQQITKSDKNLKVEDIAWTKSKVVVIAPTYTKQQLYAVRRTEDPIELYQITKYPDGVVVLEKAGNEDQKASEFFTEESYFMDQSEKAGNEDQKASEVTDNQYSEKDYMKYKASEETQTLYEKLKQEVSRIIGSDIVVRPTESYIKICSGINGKVLCTIDARWGSLNLCYKTKKLDIADDDKDSFVVYMFRPDGTKIGKLGLGDYKSKIKNVEDVTRALKYIEQVHVEVD